MNWNQEWFEWDGSWRDIYVLGTDVNDWKSLLTFLRSSSYDLVFTVDNEPNPIPSRIEEAFQIRRHANANLAVDLGGVVLMCHFFWPDEIEFDLDPREVHTQSQFRQLVRFMRSLNQLLGKPVILTPENLPEHVLLLIDSNDMPER